MKVFGNIFTKIKELKKIVEAHQDGPPSTNAQQDLNKMLLRECILWKDKEKDK